MAVLFLLGVVMVLLYPLHLPLSNALPNGIGYSVAKVIIFIALPAAVLFYIERWDIREILHNVGVRAENWKKSLIYSLAATAVTILITLLTVIVILSTPTPDEIGILYRTVMFLESFTEEFFFRGVLLVYLLKKTGSFKVAYATSVISFILIHPQHLATGFLMPATQGILLGLVAYKTKNIIGPWIGHGLNRVIPSLIRIVSGV
jgi:membrane protease YdiL (CAAX protease family)